MFLTINYVKNNNSVMQNSNEMQPNMANGSDSQSGNNMSEPPEKPDGESSDDQSEMKDKNDSSNSNQSEPPEKPDGEDNNSNENMNGGGNMPGGEAPSENNFENQNNNSSSMSIIYYVVFGVENLVLAYLIIYLIMSKFNKKTFKETFENGDKIAINVLLIIILTSILTFSDSFIVNKSKTNENGKPGDVNNSNESVTYSSANEIKEDKTVTSGDYTSETKDENALLISGDIKAELSNITVTKTGDSDGGDNTSFYGTNSALIAKDGATVTLKNITVTTDATGANGVFSYGGSATTNNSNSDGTTVNISDSTITTKKDNSGGIMTTGGGNMNASNLTITTAGISSAAIRSDRGGGTVNVDGGTYTTTGSGSPSIYSTADITVKNAKLVSKTSEGIVIEGKNKVTIEDTTLTDSNTKLNGQSTTYKNIFLYQSMSGDASSGTSEFTAKNSKITTNKGDSFYVTNTSATINLTNNKIVNKDSDGNFLRAQKDSWGNTSENGGEVTLNMTNQEATGNIVIDSISTLTMNLKTKSYYEGVINGDNEAKSIKLTLDKTSKIKLTGDSYITSLDNSLSDNSNIDFNGYKLYVNGKAIN
jgi:hypothetical protein